MSINELRLELHDIADELDDVTYDNGPIGETTPFRDKARRLRNISRQLGEIKSGQRNGGSGDFRDAPWEPR